jgi:thymidylate kinase
MADQVKVEYPGRLISIDGTRGKDAALAANELVTKLKEHGIECAVSRWDASGLFTDLAAGARTERNVSIRSLSLVYAADLAFRLRWEIRPVLEAGGVVIAAPYVDTAVAFGTICGLDEEWLRQLMRFAPPANFRALADERKINRAWKRRADRGYAEYGALMLEAAAPKSVSKPARRRMMAMLDRARGRKVFHLTTKGTGALAKALIDSRKAATRRSASKPRNGRK